MIPVLIEYLKIRIHVIRLFLFTLLMSILILSLNDAFDVWVYVFVFLILSFIVFRILDDAFSVKIDRIEHPERTYLVNEKFKLFKNATAIIIGAYLLSVYFIFTPAFFIILLLITGSVVLYILFGKHLIIFRLIPLLKYPFLLYCASIIVNNNLDYYVYLSSFFLIAGYDCFDSVKSNSNYIWKPMIFFFCCSLLLFKPWLNGLDIIFCIVPLLIIYRIRNISITPYFSIIIFPIIFFILIHL